MPAKSNHYIVHIEDMGYVHSLDPIHINAVDKEAAIQEAIEIYMDDASSDPEDLEGLAVNVVLNSAVTEYHVKAQASFSITKTS